MDKAVRLKDTPRYFPESLNSLSGFSMKLRMLCTAEERFKYYKQNIDSFFVIYFKIQSVL